MSYSEEELRNAADAFQSGVWVRRRRARDLLQEAIDELITLRQRAEELEVQNTQLREEIAEYQWQRPALWAAQQRVADYDELVLHLRDMLVDSGHMSICPRMLGTGTECAEGCVDFRYHFEDVEKKLEERDRLFADQNSDLELYTRSFCEAHQPYEEALTVCPCCEAVHQESLRQQAEKELVALRQRVEELDGRNQQLQTWLVDAGHSGLCPKVCGSGDECAEGCVDFRLHFEDAEKELKEYDEKIAVVRDERDDAEAAVQVMSLRKALLEKERDDLQAKLKRRDLKVEEGLRRLNRRQWDGDYPDKQDTRPAEWQEGEAEAHAELASGQGRTFDNGADAVRWLQDKPTYEELQQRITMQVRHIVAVSTACHKVKEQNWHLKRQLAISKAEVKRLNGTLPAYAVERYDPEQRQGHHRRLREQEVKIERLQQKVVVLKKHLAQAGEAYIARVQAMKEALRFYADDSNYGELEPATGELVNIKAWVDGGQRARTALGEEK